MQPRALRKSKEEKWKGISLLAIALQEVAQQCDKVYNTLLK